MREAPSILETVVTMKGRTDSPMDASREDAPLRQVLIVNDELDVLRSLSTLLEGSDSRVLVHRARSAPEAMRIIETTPVDIVLADHGLPGMNGIQLLGRLRSQVPGVHRMLLTAFADLLIAMHSLAVAKVEHFFPKPVDPAELI